MPDILTPPAVGAAEILHESTGLSIRRNKLNRFVVVRLHYTADPSKRSPEWRAEAAAGMSPAKWDQEYEISYEALFGAKVFPELAAGRDEIIVRPPYPPIHRDAICWGGFDFGQRNPSSFHVYTLQDGIIYSIWELFEPMRSLPEMIKKMKDCPYWSNVRYIAADPTMWSNTKVNARGITCSMADLFLEAGLSKLVRGINDEAAWVAQIRKHWADPLNPTFCIFDCCVNQIREFESAIYSSMTDRQLQTANYKETIADHNNHSLDDCKYFMNSRPKSNAVGAKPLPLMASRWATAIGTHRNPTSTRNLIQYQYGRKIPVS